MQAVPHGQPPTLPATQNKLLMARFAKCLRKGTSSLIHALGRITFFLCEMPELRFAGRVRHPGRSPVGGGLHWLLTKHLALAMFQCRRTNCRWLRRLSQHGSLIQQVRHVHHEVPGVHRAGDPRVILEEDLELHVFGHDSLYLCVLLRVVQCLEEIFLQE